MNEALAELKSRIEKKATFEAALRDFASLLSSADASTVEACGPLLKRTLVLLQTRYTGRGFWLAGRQLFSSPSLAGNALAVTALEACAEHLHDSDDEAPSASQSGRLPAWPAPFLFEGQLSGDGADTVAATSERSEAAAMELLQATLLSAYQGDGVEAPADPGASADGNAGEAEGQQGQEGGPPPGHGGGRPDAATATRIFAALRALAEARGEEFVGLEEALAASLMDGGRTAGPPPASKRAVAALKVERVSADRLAELGEGCQCAVCRNELAVGDDIQVMPCKHVFHPMCLAPWLEQHCSCPVCRTELPTDDYRYEEEKERRKEREEEERGAANAVRGGDWDYI